MDLPYAEDESYWQTSRSSADSWIEKAKKEIVKIDGRVIADGYGNYNDKASFMLVFQIGQDTFKLLWPVLPGKKVTTSIESAKRQAATFIYHQVKARCKEVRILGPRTAFGSFLLLPDGSTVQETVNSDQIIHLPALLPGIDKR